MPSTITPINTEREKKRRLDDHDSGHGRRPPTDKRTGGGGDNDNWNDRPQGRRGPRERLSRYRLGLFFALAGDPCSSSPSSAPSLSPSPPATSMPTTATSRLAAHRHSSHPLAQYRRASLSSVTMEIARRTMFRENDVMDEWLGLGKPITRRALPWLAATTLLGLVFLAGQAEAWRQLGLQHVFFATNPSSHFFYLITYTHAVHLFIGIGALASASSASSLPPARKSPDPRRLRRLVLARHGRLLALPLRPPRLLPIKSRLTVPTGYLHVFCPIGSGAGVPGDVFPEWKAEKCPTNKMWGRSKWNSRL